MLSQNLLPFEKNELKTFKKILTFVLTLSELIEKFLNIMRFLNLQFFWQNHV